MNTCRISRSTWNEGVARYPCISVVHSQRFPLERASGLATLCHRIASATLGTVNQRGTIVLGGHMSCLASADAVSETNYLKVSAQDTEKYVGVRSDFDGFLLDQSDLEVPVAAMRRFLHDYDIITENPDLPDCDWSRVR